MVDLIIEVEAILGRAMLPKELADFYEMIDLGYKSAYDIADLLKEW